MYEKLPAGQNRFWAWTLESRTRYALVRGGIYAIAYSLAILMFSSSQNLSVRRVLFITAFAVLAQGFWYPRAKPKVTNASGEYPRFL